MLTSNPPRDNPVDEVVKADRMLLVSFYFYETTFEHMPKKRFLFDQASYIFFFIGPDKPDSGK